VIFIAKDGKCTKEVFKTFMRTVTDGDKKVTLPAINAAKRWVAQQPNGSVFVG